MIKVAGRQLPAMCSAEAFSVMLHIVCVTSMARCQLLVTME